MEVAVKDLRPYKVYVARLSQSGNGSTDISTTASIFDDGYEEPVLEIATKRNSTMEDNILSNFCIEIRIYN